MCIIRYIEAQQYIGDHMRTHPEPREKNLPIFELKEIYQHMLQRNTAKSKAVFFDRDGTINAEQGYLKYHKLVSLLPTVPEALKMLDDLGFLIIIVTNQSAIERGLITYTDFLGVTEEVRKQLSQSGAQYHRFYYCPHNPDTTACECRKPEPGLLFQAAIDFGIDLQKSYFVGDKLSDLEAGQSASCKTALCRTGFGVRTEKMLDKDNYFPGYIGNSLWEIAGWITHDSQLHF